MSLELIVGPPNSGRAGEVLARLRRALERDPVLVVPAGEDVARFERDLCAGGEPAIGATIRTFGSLFDEIAAATAAAIPPPLSAPQRLAVIRAATAATDLRVLARSSRSPGFAPALDSLIAELQAALVAPADLRAAASALEGAGQELELASLYESYERLRDGAGRSDAGAVAATATATLRRDAAAWGERPLLLYGFDDLTEVQLDLIRVLASVCEVTLAVNYADRAALAARAGLLARLLAEGGQVARELPFDPSYTSRPSLRHLASALFETDAGTVPARDDGVRLLDCSGERGEAEAVGLMVARLLADGVSADDIVVVLRRPAVEGPLVAAVMREMGIPATLEAQLPLKGTAVGRSLAALCRAGSRDGTPADVLAHMRADTAARPARADWAERAVARAEAETVAALMERWGEQPPAHLRRVFEAQGPVARVRAVAVSARRIAEAAHRERAPLAGERSGEVPLDPLELRAGVAAAELLEELAAVAELPGCTAPDLAEAAEAIESATVPSWQGSAEGRVRILSPYRVRAGRARHLFCCSLQEGAFPGRGMGDPLLGEESRSRLGIPALRRREQDAEERYLFHVCVSRPTERLYLTWRSSDDEGHPSPRSPFVDEVLDLLGDDPAETARDLTRTRGLAEVVPAPSEAPSARYLARALAVRHGRDSELQRQALDSLGADLVLGGDVLELTAQIPDPQWKPGPLEHPVVLEALRSRKLLSAGSLEGWIECSYRWFVNHELAPQRLEPVADPLWLGGIVHEALQELYLEHPGSDLIPRPGDVRRWKERFGELVAELVASPERAASSPDRRLALARVRIQVEAFLDEEAASDSRLRPRPDLLERSFGFEDVEGDPGPLKLSEDFSLRGFIDRVDVDAGSSRALLRDYKTSKEVPGRVKIAQDGKLQLPLYMLVVRECLGMDPIGGLYHPLGAYNDRRGRGVAVLEEVAEGGALEGVGIVTRGKDAVEREEFDAELVAARALAVEQGTRMRDGKIDRDPHERRCPKYCEYQPICRLERALGLEDELQQGDGE